MALATDNQQLKSKLKVSQYDFDPDANTATEIAWVDMKDRQNLLVSFFRTVGTSDLTFRLLGNDQSDGSGTDVELKVSSADADATGDYGFLEVTNEELAGKNVRYVTAEVTVATAGDEGVVTYISEGKRAYLDQVADVIA